MSDTNTTHPYQPGYVRPDPHPDDSYQPHQVTARAVATGDTAAERAHSTMVNALDGFKKHIEGVTKEQHRWSVEGFREQIAGFANTDAVKAVDTAVAQVQARRDQAAAKVAKVRADLAPNGDTAAELRATRFWNRTKGLLDAQEGSVAASTAQNMIRDASREELGTLLQELPAYLAAHGHGAGWIDAVVDQAVPEYASARKELQKAEQSFIIARTNANSLKKSIADGYVSSVLTPPGKYDPDR